MARLVSERAIVRLSIITTIGKKGAFRYLIF